MAKYGIVSASSKEIVTIVLVLIGIILILPWLLKQTIKSTVSNAGELANEAYKAGVDIYTGKDEMQNRTQAESARTTANQIAFADLQPIHVISPEWLNEPVVVDTYDPIAYDKARADAESWMIPHTGDIGITAPYGSETYNTWAKAHPLDAYSEVPVAKRTIEENVLYGTARIQDALVWLWNDSFAGRNL